MEFNSYLTIIILIIVSLVLFLTFENKNNFKCPECKCPKCEECKVCSIPSNENFIEYLNENFIDPIIAMQTPSVDYMKKNIVFSDENTMIFQTEYMKIFVAIQGSIINNKYKINANNLRYLYPKDQETTNVFLTKYRLSEFPTPLLTFDGTGLQFGYLSSTKTWKIFIDNPEILKQQTGI